MFNSQKVHFYFIIILLLVHMKASGQKISRCGTEENTRALLLQDTGLAKRVQRLSALRQTFLDHPEFNKTDVYYTIPVVVHVLYNSAYPEQNISDAQIYSQISVLNQDYSRTNSDSSKTPTVWKHTAGASNFQFALAGRDSFGNPCTGIIRKSTTNASFVFGSHDERFSSKGGDNAWDRDQYLNIWVVPSISSSSGSEVLGYCTTPGCSKSIDGVTVGYKFFGKSDKSSYYNLGRTVTHEAGHWLGLYHVWAQNNNDCASSDSVADTPNQANSSNGQPVFPVTDMCTPNYPGVMFMNFMDYTDDAGMNMFTNGQIARMNATLDAFRPSIKTSKGAIVGMPPEPAMPAFHLFPNPSNGIVELTGNFASAEPVRVTVYTLLGNSIFAETMQGNQMRIHLADAAEGCYLVKITCGHQSVFEKIVIVKQ
jgi:hypothetical protein